VGTNDSQKSHGGLFVKRLGIIIGLIGFSCTSLADISFSNYHLHKRGRLALQVGNAASMEESYAKILKTNPKDEEAAYKVALAQSWQPAKMDTASSNFDDFLKKHPAHKEALIAYANLECWRQNPSKAFALLDRYKVKFGATKEYLSTQARLLTLTGFYNQALVINGPLLATNPDDYDLLYTNVSALHKANRFKEARTELQKLKKIQPDKKDTQELEKIFLSLEESILSTGINYYQDNQGIKNVMFPLSLDWAYNDSLHFVFKGLHEVLFARKNSGLETLDKKTSIYDNSVLAGVKWRIMPRLALVATAGDLKIQHLSNKFIYLLNANLVLAENANLDLFHSRDLYRPYLFPTSPKAVSKGIVEDLTNVKLFWQPLLKTFIKAQLGYSTLSDGNDYAHVYFSPTKKIALNAKSNLTFGANVDFLSFAQQLHHGYYDPKLHQEYLAIAGLSYSPTTYLSSDISMGAGLHRDQLTEGFQPAYSAYGSVFYVVAPWEVNISGDYTFRGNSPGCKSFQGFSAEAQLTLRF
jgi:tetratricopeptide (TPR) repeat protein